tara:strand:+ start:1199 stop:1651 length:453 start_codon:yes stop_codon:yes gene_type:complete
MAIKDTTKKPFIEDRDTNIFVGLDLPIRRGDGKEGYFASTSTTIEAVKNNIKNLLKTDKGERLMQPNFGLNLKSYLFEQITNELILLIQNDIVDTFRVWLPFVDIKELKVIPGPGGDVGDNTLNINIVFNIKQDPTTLASVQVLIDNGGE